MITKTAIGSLNIKQANTFLTRLKGLLGTSHLSETEGLLISPCNSVHTIGMRYNISLICLDLQGRVLSTKSNIVPNRFFIAPKGTHQILEVSATMKNLHTLKLGQKFFI